MNGQESFLTWTIRWSLLCVCGLAVTPNSVFAQWLQWGGPNQDFRSDATGLATNWPQTGPTKMWERPLGDGYSAILVQNDMLYTMYRKDGNEIIIALNAQNGETIWEHKYAISPAPGHAVQYGTGPRSTPLISGDHLYAIGVSGVMTCLDVKTGTKKWGIDLWEEFDGNKLNHGYSSSPIAYGDNVIVLVGGKGASLVSLNKKSGNVVWKNQDFKNSYSTPKVIKLDGKDQLVTFMATEIIGVDPTDGRLEWSYPHENRWKQNVCQPIWNEEHHILFFSSTGPGARGLKLTRSGDKTITEELWSTKKIQFYHVTSVSSGDYVYGSTGGQAPHFFSAINIKTGKIAWRKRGFSKATCVMADGRLVILDEDGQLALATATPTDFTVHSKYSLFDDVSWTVPTVVGTSLYVRDKSKILALDLGTPTSSRNGRDG